MAQPKHARYYDSRFIAVLAWVAVQLLGVWCAVARTRFRHAAEEIQLPAGADEQYAEDLHAMQMTAAEKAWLAAEIFFDVTEDARDRYVDCEEVDA